PHAAGGGRRRRGARGPDQARPRRRRPLPPPRLRQPAQGRGAERDPDRRARPLAAPRRGLDRTPLDLSRRRLENPIPGVMRPARLDHTFFDNEPRSHLGALLLRKGLLTNEELDRALEEKEQGELLGEALVRLRICFEDDIARVLGEQSRVEFIDIGITSVDYRAVDLLPWTVAEQLRAIPVRVHADDTVSVAVIDPSDETLLPSLKLALGGREVRLLVTTPSALRAAWATGYRQA